MHQLDEITGGGGDFISLSIRWNSVRFVVNLEPSPAGDGMEDSLIKQYDAACDAEDYEEGEAISDRILDAIVEVGRPTFDRLAPPPVPGTTSSTSTDRHTLLFPKEYSFRFRSRNDGRTELTLTDEMIEPQHGWSSDLSEEYIPSSSSSDTAERRLTSLRDVEPASSIAEVRRRKWAFQVRETVRLLHQIGVTWGDGKASNVLIHGDTDDAWVVDFGGGWTDGWVGPELSGTVEGDELAVKKIFAFLEVSGDST